MRASPLLVVLMVALVALAGCIGGTGAPADNASADDGTASDGTSTQDLAFDQGVPDNATIGGAHAHPQWDGQDTKVLFDGQAQAGDCYGTFGLIFNTVFNSAFRQRVEMGCAVVPMDNGTLVPQGTEKIQVEADGSQALQQGGWTIYAWSDENFYEGAPTEEAQTTWWFDLAESDWDDPHQSRTDLGVVFWAHADDTGEIAQLEGPIDVTITAHKIPNWTAPLAAAHVDHWVLDDRHTFVKPGVASILDENVTVDQCVWADFATGSCEFQDPVAFEDIVLPGTAQVVVLMTWDQVDDCAPAHTCEPSAYVSTGGSSWTWDSPAERGDGYVIYLYEVPDELPEDSTYANASESAVNPTIDHCLRPEGLPFSFNSCGLGNANWGPSVDLRIVAEAWRGAVALDDFKERHLG